MMQIYTIYLREEWFLVQLQDAALLDDGLPEKKQRLWKNMMATIKSALSCINCDDSLTHPFVLNSLNFDVLSQYLTGWKKTIEVRGEVNGGRGGGGGVQGKCT